MYLVLICLFQMGAILPCATLEKMTIAHAFCVREIHFDSDQYGLFISDYYFVVTLLIPKPKCESPRRSIAYYRCILLSNVLGKCTLRGQAIACANCLRISDEICRPRAQFFRIMRNHSTSTTKCELPMHAS